MGVRISALTETTTMADANTLPTDTTGGTRRISWANLKATLKTYFDGLYAPTMPQAEWRADTHAGYGSTDTKIPYYTNVRVNADAAGAMTVVNNSTNGCKVTINTAGIYSITVGYTPTDQSSVGISLNSTQLTTGVAAINAQNRLVASNSVDSGANAVSITLNLAVNDVIRPHTDGAGTSVSARAHFSICRVR